MMKSDKDYLCGFSILVSALTAVFMVLFLWLFGVIGNQPVVSDEFARKLECHRIGKPLDFLAYGSPEEATWEQCNPDYVRGIINLPGVKE